MNTLRGSIVDGNIDNLKLGADGSLSIAGWAVDRGTEDCALTVNAYYRGELLGRATTGLPRPDVKDYFQNPEYLYSGWQFQGTAPADSQLPLNEDGIIIEIKEQGGTVNYFASNERFRVQHVFPYEHAIPLVAESHIPGSETIWDNSREHHCKNDFKLYWALLREVEKYQMKAITGSENLHYFDYLIDYIEQNIGAQNLRGLFIGCQEWDPAPERILVERGLFNRIEVLDIADGLLKKQEQLARERGMHNTIEYRKTDCNFINLDADSYDVIFAIGTVHHIEKLELLFSEINKALKKNGFFVMMEYVGPSRLQFTDEQVSITNEILSLLPKKYKLTAEGFLKDRYANTAVEEVVKSDPSEAVCPESILPVMKSYLDIIKMEYTGGTILYPLLGGIASNFEMDEDGEALIKLLILFEKTLIEKGVLSSDYVFCMAKKRLN
jgi:ubiquinone/menaquinone biosynthesis C-methylase UbiE